MAWVQNLKNYVLESYGEMRKVTWPTKQQTINYSLLVIALSISMAVFFAILDWVFSNSITALLNR